MAGPIAKEISEEFQVSPRRSASLLDIFTSVGQGTDSVRCPVIIGGQSDRINTV